VRTGHGVSEDTYGNRVGRPKIAGELQGKGDVAPLYALLSSTIMDAHAKLYEGICLNSPVPGPSIRKRNDGYVDDVNTWAASMEVGILAEEDVMYKLKKGAQTLTELNETSGGATAFHKCATQVLAWQSDGKCLRIKPEVEGRLILKDNKGAASSISNLRSDQANTGLGYHMAVDANQKSASRERMGKIKQTCDGAQSACLNFDEAYQLLNRRLLAQTKYGLHLSQYTPKDCKPMTVLINGTFLPLLHIHRRMKREVVWGPLNMGGLGLNTDIYSLQCQCAVSYLMRTMRWDGVVATDIRTALNAFQLASGFLSPVLEHTATPIKYVGKGWIPNLREMLNAINAGLWIEQIWRPQKQRQHDVGIMEEFAKDSTLTPLTKELANELRMWMRVTSIAELAAPDGKRIPIERIRNGSEWRAVPEEGIWWPNTAEPTDRHRAAFRKCLRSVFCSTANPYNRTNDYELDQPLGHWYPVRRLIQFDAYRSKDMIYYRDEMGLHPCTERDHQRGFFDAQDREVQRPPLKSHPITPNVIAPGVLWTRKARRMVKQRVATNDAEVTKMQIPYDRVIDHLDLVSDAAVYVEQSVGAAAWRAILEDDSTYSARITLDVNSDSYSYREELMGIYFAIRDILIRLPKIRKVTCHCDSKSAIDKINDKFEDPGQLMKADMDIVMAIKSLLRETETDFTFEHVPGHAERRKRPSEMTRMERANVACDKEAGEKVAMNEAPVPFSPLPGCRCMLRIRDRWITSRPDEAIKVAFVSEPLKEYTAKRLGIPLETVDELDQEAMGTVRSMQKWSQRGRGAKMLFGWLPVGHNWKHHGAESDLCPCCGEPDETFIHLLQCKDPEITLLRAECLKDITKAAASLRVPSAVYSIMILILRRVHEDEEPEEPQMSLALQRAWQSQKRVGFTNMAIGWLSKEWTKAMRAHGASDPEGSVAQMLTLIWDAWCEPIWDHRNSRLHKDENPAMDESLRKLENRLRWYRDNKTEVLASRHHFLAEFRIADVIKWDRRQRRAQLKMLDNARRIYEIECKQRVQGQRVITDMFLTLDRAVEEEKQDEVEE
jgi:hypothetical protein